MDCVQVCGQSKARAHSYLISSLSPPHFPRTPHFTQFLHLFLLCRIILWNKNASKLCLFPNLLHKSYFYQLFYTLISHYSNFDYLYCCFCSHHENLAQNSCTRFPCFKCVSPKISEWPVWSRLEKYDSSWWSLSTSRSSEDRTKLEKWDTSCYLNL